VYALKPFEFQGRSSVRDNQLASLSVDQQTPVAFHRELTTASNSRSNGETGV